MVSAFTFAVERSSDRGRPVKAARRFFTTCSDQVLLIINCVANKGDLPNLLPFELLPRHWRCSPSWVRSVSGYLRKLEKGNKVLGFLSIESAD